MPIRYVRVKHKITGHEYDQREDQVDPKKVDVLERHGTSSRPRPAKPLISKGGGSTTPGDRDKPLTARSSRKKLEAAAEAAGLPVDSETTNQQIVDALAAAPTGDQ